VRLLTKIGTRGNCWDLKCGPDSVKYSQDAMHVLNLELEYFTPDPATSATNVLGAHINMLRFSLIMTRMYNILVAQH